LATLKRTEPHLRNHENSLFFPLAPLVYLINVYINKNKSIFLIR
jgi:hypothetical protein